MTHLAIRAPIKSRWRSRSRARRCRAARLEALAAGPEVDARAAPGMRVSVRVHRRGGAVDAVRVRREVADHVDRDPELERDQLVRHASRLAIERRALTDDQRSRVRRRRSPHGSTRSHSRRATRMNTVANGRRTGAGRVLRSSRPSAATPGHTRGLAAVRSARAPALFTRLVDVDVDATARPARWLWSKLGSDGRSGSCRRARKVPISCGGEGIRTLGSLATPAVFKCAGNSPDPSRSVPLRADLYQCSPTHSVSFRVTAVKTAVTHASKNRPKDLSHLPMLSG